MNPNRILFTFSTLTEQITEGGYDSRDSASAQPPPLTEPFLPSAADTSASLFDTTTTTTATTDSSFVTSATTTTTTTILATSEPPSEVPLSHAQTDRYEPPTTTVTTIPPTVTAARGWPDTMQDHDTEPEPLLDLSEPARDKFYSQPAAGDELHVEVAVDGAPAVVQVADEVEYDDEQATLEERHRLASSSYEDIYRETKFPTDGDDDEIEITAETIGDRFDTKHADTHLVSLPDGKSSSYENLYVESGGKEAESVEEKDIDEKEKDEVDIDRPEKGEGEDMKDGAATLPTDELSHVYDHSRTAPETLGTVDSHSHDSIERPVKLETHSVTSTSIPPKAKVLSPIDVTYESGLDLIGQEERLGEHERDVLERSQSYDSEGVTEHGSSETHQEELRQRHYSSPDDVLHSRDVTEFAAVAEDKGSYPHAQ